MENGNMPASTVFDTIDQLMDHVNMWLRSLHCTDIDQDFIGQIKHLIELDIYSDIIFYQGFSYCVDDVVYWGIRYGHPILYVTASSRNHGTIEFRYDRKTKQNPNEERCNTVFDLRECATTDQVKDGIANAMRTMLEKYEVPDIDRIVETYAPAIYDIQDRGGTIDIDFDIDSHDNIGIECKISRVNNRNYPYFGVIKKYHTKYGVIEASKSCVIKFDVYRSN